ncbi:MFS transporter [Streptomyces populi]|uniref:MFS transporter n=1 Tax=Streptomyces populi TaxID=2058924 RepID=A0A2I0SQE2_9ACTN|nr:MFS transporter [Streptomyces populi]PKT72147.1 MFS transporter [Streptomyces populi]
MTAVPTVHRPPAGISPATGGGTRAWTVTALLVVFMMVNFADKSVLGLAADEIRSDLHLSATRFGLANSAFFLFFSVAAVAVGLAADRLSTKALILVMAVLWSVAQVPAALGGGLGVLVASRVFLGAAEGPAFPVAQKAALAWFPDDRRNLPGALVTLGVTLGVIVSAPGLSWMIQHHGWRAALWTLAAAGLVWATAWAAFGADGGHFAGSEAGAEAGPATGPATGPAVPPAAGPRAATETVAGAATEAGPQAQVLRPSVTRADAPYRKIFASRTWIGVTLAYFTSYWSVALMLVWLPSYLRNALGYPADLAGTVVIAPWLVGALALLAQAGITGRLMRRGTGSRRARGWVGGALLALGAACCLALPLADGRTATTVLVALGFGLGGSYATIAATTVTELAPPSRGGGALGTMNAVVTAAGLAAPAVVGALVDARGTDGYQTAVVLSGLLLALGAAASFLLVDPQRDIARLDGRPPAPTVRPT